MGEYSQTVQPRFCVRFFDGFGHKANRYYIYRCSSLIAIVGVHANVDFLSHFIAGKVHMVFALCPVFFSIFVNGSIGTLVPEAFDGFCF